MMKLFVGGAAFAALFVSAAAFAQTAAPATSTMRTHRSHSYFARNENRSDVAKHVEKMFARFDLNRDGFITKDEVATTEAAYQARQQQQAPKRAAKLFERLDANHDGVLSRAEMSHHPNAAHMAMVDESGDGVLSREEYDALQDM